MNKILRLAITFIFVLLMAPVSFAEDPTEPILTPPFSPEQVTVTGIQETRATVSWSPVSTATQYTVWVDGQRWGSSTCLTAEIVGLEAYTDYIVYVTAANAAGESGCSPSVLFRTLPPIPTMPERPVASQVTDNKATIQWQPLPSWQHILGYRIYVDGQATADVDPQEGIQTVELTNLQSGVHYVAVSGVNENQEGYHSQTVQFTIRSVPAPTGLVLANRSHDRLLLTWDEVAGAIRYKVHVSGNLAGETKEPSYLVGGLTDEAGYQIAVTAVLDDGNESVPAIIDVQTRPLTGLTLSSLMSSIYEYVPDIIPGMIIIFVIGGALKIANTGKFAISKQLFYRGF